MAQNSESEEIDMDLLHKQVKHGDQVVRWLRHKFAHYQPDTQVVKLTSHHGSYNIRVNYRGKLILIITYDFFVPPWCIIRYANDDSPIKPIVDTPGLLRELVIKEVLNIARR